MYSSTSKTSSASTSTKTNIGNSLVRQGQQYLIKRGFSVGSTGADGYYGKNTNIGLVKFLQTQLNTFGAGLAVDGSRGPLTQSA